MPKNLVAPELKHVAIELSEIKLDDDSRTIEGYASVFNNIDSYNDIVMPGAFKKTLKGKSMIPMLWQHRSDQVIGKWDTFEEENKGLMVKGTILDTTQGEDAYKLVKAGAITGMSIGYSTKKYEIDQDKGTRKLTEVDLYEVSLVTFPANERAQITRVKSLDGKFMTEREFEEFLREVGGLSHKESKIVISEGYKKLVRHREEKVEPAIDISRLTNILKQFK